MTCPCASPPIARPPSACRRRSGSRCGTGCTSSEPFQPRDRKLHVRVDGLTRPSALLRSTINTARAHIKLTHRLQLGCDFQELILHLDADFFALKATKSRFFFGVQTKKKKNSNERLIDFPIIAHWCFQSVPIDIRNS